ncbi:hypothetical protein U9M48_025889, partial [Paspalum notatum var. saurae]
EKQGADWKNSVAEIPPVYLPHHRGPTPSTQTETAHGHSDPTAPPPPRLTPSAPPMQGSSSSSCAAAANPSSEPEPAPAVPGGARRVVAAHRLPLRAAPDPASPFGFAFSLDPDALALQLSRGLPAAHVTFVGTLPASVGSTIAPSDELDDYLLRNFSCLPVHLHADLHADFYHGFCKRYLWPRLHYLLPHTPRDAAADLRFDAGKYRAFLAANRRFADRVLQVLSPDPDDGDLVVVHDYHLWVLPTFLRRKCPRAGVGFFLHAPFPSGEIFRAVPVRDDLLRGLLGADLVGFHTFDYARHFLSCCSRLLGVVSSSSGNVGVDYHGRAVLVKVFSVGLDMGRIRATLASPEAAAKAQEIADAYRGRALLVGVDDVDRSKGVSLKLLALERMLEEDGDLGRQVVLVQINNPARSRGRHADAVADEAERIGHRINKRFAGAVVFIDGPVPLCEKVAYYAAADCCVVSPLRDGLNRIPYFYTVCREEFPGARKSSAVVLSEFAGCSPSLGGAIRVNPWNLDGVADAMRAAITMSAEEKQARHRSNYGFLRAHDAVTWAQSFDAALRAACRGLPDMRFTGLGFGMSYRAVGVEPSFTALTPELIRKAYRAAARRLILLDYDGTLVPELVDEGKRAPSDKVLRVLDELCADPKNVVFLVSGRRKDQLEAWFAPCQKLGLSAEHGYFTRWSRDDDWEESSDNDEQLLYGNGNGWKAAAERLMTYFTEATDGSYMEKKEKGALAWHYQKADPVLGPCQAKDLYDHLASVLANEPATVRSRGGDIVEVDPQGVTTKGAAVEALLAAMAGRRLGGGGGGDAAPDLVLCVGDGEADEGMFEALATAVSGRGGEGGARRMQLLPAGAAVFTCTVGLKPSKAVFYLDGPEDVRALLRALARCCAPDHPMEDPAAASGMFEIVPDLLSGVNQ